MQHSSNRKQGVVWLNLLDEINLCVVDVDSTKIILKTKEFRNVSLEKIADK